MFNDIFVNVNEYIPQNKWQAEIGDISRMNENLTFLVQKMP